MDQLLNDLTDDLPGWLGVVIVVVIVGAGWFGTSQLMAWAHRRAGRQRAIREQTRLAKSLRPGYARSSAALKADPDAFALSASAWLAHASGQPLDEFAYRDTPRLRQTLSHHYQVSSPDDLWPKLVRTLVEGHRTWPHGDADGPIDFVAWDLVRVIELCRAGLCLGVLDEDEAWDLARFAAATLQKRYRDWPELGSQVERAYRHSHDPVSRHQDRLARIECDGIRTMLSGPDGPWTVVPWRTRVLPADLYPLEGVRTSPSRPAPAEAWERPVFARLAGR